MVAADPGTTTRDGRSERAARNRAAVVDALLAFFAEGELRPTAPRIAERAGVAPRTVFHLFDDVEALFAAARQQQMQRLLAMARRVPRDGPLEDRIASFTTE